MADQPTPQEVAEAAAEVAAVEAAISAAASRPDVYVSRERGPVPIESMHPTWAGRAANAVKEGRRPEDRPAVVKPLERRAREG